MPVMAKLLFVCDRCGKQQMREPRKTYLWSSVLVVPLPDWTDIHDGNHYQLMCDECSRQLPETTSNGVIAQQGEHLNGIQKVEGSTPSDSIDELEEI